MNNDASFYDAKRLYLEQYGDPMVTNTYLKIALVLVSLVAVGLALVDLKTIRTFQNFRPLVIRIDDLGRAEAINYHNLEYKPQDAEAKYFLSQFCALYYRRNRYTIQTDFSKSLYFLDGKLADGILDAYRKDDIIKKFITNTSAPDIDIDVKKVALEEMQTPPFRARVDFYMVFNSAADHSELKRDLYTANFVFVFKTHVPNELIPINPLGLSITYFQMNGSFRSLAARVAGGRLASSAQPPRATPVFSQNASSPHGSQPNRSMVFGDTPGALLEGLRCFTASRPLLSPRSDVRKNHPMLSLERS
jgi:type IV secretory pathway TrbF-like protein